MDRIKKLCGYLEKCESFADVGCDHGYCTQYMLKEGLCKTAVISDVSGKCLEKAENLLKPYIESGAVTSVCCNGLEKIPQNTDLVLIAGMGGEEIVNILKTAYIPGSFVFQPMKNAQKLREYLLCRGAEITVDEPFESGGKFYFVLKGKNRGKICSYSEAQLKFGKDLQSEATRKYLEYELTKKQGYLQRQMSAENRTSLETEVKFIEDILNGVLK